MKYLPWIGLLLAFMVPSCNTGASSSSTLTQDLDSLYEKERYFLMKGHFEEGKDHLKKTEARYYDALLRSAFFRHLESNEIIEKMLSGNGRKIAEEYLKNLHEAKYHNHQNLFQYSKALDENKLLLGEFSQYLDSAEMINLENEQKLLEPIIDISPQQIIKTRDCGIKLIIDKLELVNIPVKFGDEVIEFLFDTGSSFSFIRRSLAERLGYKVLDTDFEVEMITGKKILTDLVVVDTLFLGSVEVRNAVFWVFDDKDLTLPEFEYSVNGAIAIPVLRSLDEFHIIGRDSIFIPLSPGNYALNNLALDGIDPIISVVHEKDTMPWYFDTGASFSSFYKPFYLSFKNWIETNFHQHSYDVGGVGGTTTFTSYIIDSTELTAGNQSAMIYDVEIHTDYIYRDPEKVYGNLGQDFMGQFDRMIISTASASILFE